jgi:uncharacterized protein (DUF934 family)
MALLKDGSQTEDVYTDVSADETTDFSGTVIISVEQWLANKDALSTRKLLGIVLRSDEKPELIKDDLEHFSVIALDFPTFRDGRAYSHARVLRSRYGYSGELRAVGDVLLEQLHYMHRVGFNSFAVAGNNAIGDWETACADFSVWYQPTSDGRDTTTRLRHSPDPVVKLK